MSGALPVLTLSGIVKSFGPVQALRGVDFSLAAGQVHALLGENGAGKSTLLSIAYGMTSPDAGTIRVRGAGAVLRSPREARGLGIGMVHQHFTSIEALTVGENIDLVTGATAGGRGASARSVPRRLMEGLDLGARVETLPVSLRQRLEIGKALSTGASILLLDEPSAVLTPSEVEELLALVREFVAAGGAVALVTHKLGEVFLAADRVTVLRQGRVTLSGEVARESERSLAEAMIGAAGVGRPEGVVAAAASRPPVAPAGGVARPEGIRVGGIEVHAGELVGIAAVAGNGERELLRGIAAGQGAVLVPEDRTLEGLIPDLTVTENIVLGLDRDPRWARGRVIDWRVARRRAAELIGEYSILADGPDAPVRTLSGGNQQKVVLARALERGPRVLVAENPTRGLDIRATAFVHRRLRAAAEAGMIVLLYSADLDEVLELGSRVLVVRAGTVREAPRGADRSVVGAMMLGTR